MSAKQCYSTGYHSRALHRRASPTSDAVFATIISMKIAGLLSRSGRELPGVYGFGVTFSVTFLSFRSTTISISRSAFCPAITAM